MEERFGGERRTMDDSMNEWSVNTLKEYIFELMKQQSDRIDQRFEGVNQRFVDQNSAVEKALVVAEKAVEKALNSAEKAVEKEQANVLLWRQNANEWRGSMLDREERFMARAEAMTMFNAIEDKVDGVKGTLDRIVGQTGGVDKSRTMLFAIIAAIAALLGIYGVLK